MRKVVSTPRRWRWGIGVIVLLTLALFPILFRPEVAILDPVGYYSWARSTLIDGDLDVGNEFAHYGTQQGVPLTPTGYTHNQWAAGTAFAWLPGMGLAHLAVTAPVSTKDSA